MGLTPPDNGTKIMEVEFPPLNEAALAKMDPNFMMKVVRDNAPKRGIPVSNPLEHRTRTLDYPIITSGEIDMMLDDKTVHVKAGRRRHPAGDQPRLAQPRHRALPHYLRAAGFEGAVKSGLSIFQCQAGISGG
jgi:hypothetical protein